MKNKTIIDLTHKIIDGMPVFPGDVPMRLQPTVTFEHDGVANHLLSCSVHAGTHIDAPGHFTVRDIKVTDFPIEKFMGKTVCFDVRDMQEIGIEVVQGRIEQDDIILFYSGWDKNFYEHNYFIDYPILSVELAHYLVDCKVKMIGIDFPSPDKIPYVVHKILLDHDILIIENLTNLDLLQECENIELIALPLKIEAHGAPARVVAIIKKQ